VVAFINNLVDGHFPFLKTHRIFLLDCSIASCDLNRDVGMIEADRIASGLHPTGQCSLAGRKQYSTFGSGQDFFISGFYRVWCCLG
jgi:hypothetical protein